MVVFELIKPGTWLDGMDHDKAWEINGLIDSLISSFFEANLALNLFEKERVSNNERTSCSDFEQRQNEKRLIQEKVESAYKDKGLNIFEYYDQIRTEVDVLINREAWIRGEVPRQFSHNMPFIYAKIFLFALDAFDRFLGVLSKEDGVPESLTEIHGKIKCDFPSLRGVRNTAHHLEDRSRGLEKVDRNGKKHKLKNQPIENSFIHAPEGGVLIINSLNGNNYGSTMADGHYGEVDISIDSLSKLRNILDETINAFEWTGPASVYPSRQF